MARPFALLRTQDQWTRCTHDRTTIDPDTGGVQLSWSDPDPVEAGGAPAPARGGGLAFDAECRLYHSVPREGRLERILWRAHDPLAPLEQQAAPLDLLAPDTEPSLGDFAATGTDAPLREPRGLAVDVDDRLFVAETGARRILVFDLWSRRLLRRVALPGRPLDLVARGRDVFAVVEDPPGLLRLRARSEPEEVALPAGPAGAAPQRIAVDPEGALFLLFRDGAGNGWVVPSAAPAHVHAVPGATDVECEGAAAVVVARRPGDAFDRLRLGAGGWLDEQPLTARGYDGLGIVRTPDGRIGFWTANGFREAVAARVRYEADGSLGTYRLDAGEFQTQWGRLFLDACVPTGTQVRASFATTDEADDDEDTVAWQPPARLELAARPPGSPPLRPLALLPGPARFFHRRETGRELAWARPAADDPYETYETPVAAPPGRYLWVTLELSGTTRATPRIRCLRAEHPSHDYLRRLPKTFSREPAAADFLQRYLAIFDGALGDLDGRASDRQALLEPHGAPQELLGWLAGFLGLVLDDRWSVPVRRNVIAEASCLFRFRGTVRGVEHFVELVLGSRTRVIALEHWRLRGLGGALVSEPSAAFAGTVVGASFRVGGELGVAGEAPLTGSVEDAFRTHAHRFTLVVPALMSPVEAEIVQRVLDVHRPAHTIVDVCSVDAGMRVGRGLHVGLLSLVGRTGGFAQLQVGGSTLGRDRVLGRPEPGTVPGASRLGRDTRVG